MRCKAAACDALQLALLLAVAHATHAQLLARLLAEAPKETVIVGHSLDLAVKLIEVRRRHSSQRPAATLTPAHRRRPSAHAASR